MADRTFLDWPFFNDTHRELARALDTWCTGHLANLSHDESDVDAVCKELLRRLAQGGWLKYAVPRQFGGTSEQLDVRSLCVIRETLARHSGLADFVFAMQGLGSGAITSSGNDAQREAWLPRVANGTAMAAFALTELKSGSDVANLETRVDDLGDRFRVNGSKTFISNGGIADFYTLFGRTGEGPGAKGISAFIVGAKTPGLKIVERIRVMAPHPLATLAFEDMVLPKSSLIGERGAGFKVAMATLDIFRSTVGAAALGFARRALDEALHRTSGRKLFGGRLVELPVVQADLADMATMIDTAALLIYRAAWTRDVAKRRNTREAAMAKMHATESAQRVIDKAVQMHGGLGVVHGVPVEALYREIRALRIYEGATEVQRVVIARQLLDAFASDRSGN